MDPCFNSLSVTTLKTLIVNAYLVFYVEAVDIIEIRRIVSSKRNYTKLL